MLAACEREFGEPRWTGEIARLERGGVLVRNPRSGIWKPGSEWRLIETLRIGGREGPGAEVFGQVVHLAVDPNRRIYVLDGHAQEIRVFTEQGRFLRAIGRPGAGPAEFRNAIAMVFGPDGNLWVVDPGNGRYTVVDTTGRAVATHPRPHGGNYSLPWAGGFDGRGRFYEVVPLPAPDEVLFAFGPTFTIEQSVPLPRIARAQFEHRRGRSSMIAAGVPFSASLVRYFDPRGYVWFAITDRYRIYQTTFTGDTVRVVERSFERARVTERDREVALRNLSWFTEQGGRIDESRIPTLKPAIQDILVDTEGYLWVWPIEADADDVRFDVFDPAGRYLGKVRADPALAGYPRPLILGDRLYGVSVDESGVSYVVVARVLRDTGRGQGAP